MKHINKFLIFSVLFLAVGSIVYFISLGTTQPTLQNGSFISPQQVKNAIDAKEKVTIVDVRRPEEYKTGHLKNSILLTLDTINAKAVKILPDKNKNLYVYCRTGKRSAQAVTQLQQMGYTNVHSMDGGITAWQGAGYPVEK